MPAPETREPVQSDPPSQPEFVANPGAAVLARLDTALPRKGSLIPADITIEGKIDGDGRIRIVGKFEGDVDVQGRRTIGAGARLTGDVRADRVTIAGYLEGNVEQASPVDLRRAGVVIGDLKADSLTVAAGARLRGQAEFAWDHGTGAKAGNPSNVQGTLISANP